MLKATINEAKSFEIQNSDNQILLNNEVFVWDLKKISSNDFHILKNNQSYNAELVEANYDEKSFEIKVNGTIHHVILKDKTDLLLEKMGLNSSVSSKINDLKAPMPGLIYELKVNIGDEVQKGDVLLILVAMKMENSIKAIGNGKIKNIKVKTNDTVEKGQIMIEFE